MYLSSAEDVNENDRELKEKDSILVDNTVHLFGDGQTIVVQDYAGTPVVASPETDDKPVKVGSRHDKEDKKSSSSSASSDSKNSSKSTTKSKS